MILRGRLSTIKQVGDRAVKSRHNFLSVNLQRDRKRGLYFNNPTLQMATIICAWLNAYALLNIIFIIYQKSILFKKL